MKRLGLLLLVLMPEVLMAVSAEVLVGKNRLETYGVCDGCYLRDLDFSNVHPLPGVVIKSMTNSDLTGADFTGQSLRNVDFTGANLTRANFTGADLTGANLAGTKLKNTIITDANLRNIWT